MMFLLLSFQSHPSRFSRTTTGYTKPSEFDMSGSSFCCKSIHRLCCRAPDFDNGVGYDEPSDFEDPEEWRNSRCPPIR